MYLRKRGVPDSGSAPGFRSLFNRLLAQAGVRQQRDGGEDSASTSDANVSNLHCSVGTVRRERGFDPIHPPLLASGWYDGGALKIEFVSTVIFQFTRKITHKSKFAKYRKISD